MKISCFKYDLVNAINIALKAVPSKSTMTILESFLINATASDIRIISNDNEMGIETSVIGKINEPGKIAIDAKIFSEIIRKLPDNVVIIECEANNKMHITCESSEFNITGYSADEFPELPYAEEDNNINMSQFTLKEIVRQTIFSIAQNDSNSIMRGELFEINGNHIKVTSLDSHRISIRNENLDSAYRDEKVIIPGKTLLEISRMLSGEKDDRVDIIFDKKFIKFIFGNTMVISRLIEGEFFNVDRMISSDYSTVVRINKNSFLDEVDRAMALTRETEKKPVVISIEENRMLLELTSSLGSMSGEVEIKKEGKDQIIGFNPRFLIEALRVIDDEEISIYFVNSNAPCFICNDIGSYIYIILPVNINR